MGAQKMKLIFVLVLSLIAASQAAKSTFKSQEVEQVIPNFYAQTRGQWGYQYPVYQHSVYQHPVYQHPVYQHPVHYAAPSVYHAARVHMVHNRAYYHYPQVWNYAFGGNVAPVEEKMVDEGADGVDTVFAKMFRSSAKSKKVEKKEEDDDVSYETVNQKTVI